MALTPFSLASALKAIGVAEVFVGDPLTTGGMSSLGATEGTISFEAPQTLNPLTAPELTGEAAHQATVVYGAVRVTVPLILGDPTIFAKISPTGSKSAGNSVPQKVFETSVLIIPRAELGGGLSNTGSNWTRTAGNGVAAATGVGAAPQNAIWMWRATPTFAALPFSYGNGGKVITEVTFTAMFDVSKPEGHKLYTIGDPTAITPTPIAVVM